MPGHSMHIRIRCSKYGPEDLGEDAGFGFTVLGTWEIEQIGIDGYVTRIREQVGERPLYLSLDIDVLDPAFAPATGTPEVGGLQLKTDRDSQGSAWTESRGRRCRRGGARVRQRRHHIDCSGECRLRDDLIDEPLKADQPPEPVEACSASGPESTRQAGIVYDAISSS